LNVLKYDEIKKAEIKNGVSKQGCCEVLMMTVLEFLSQLGLIL